MQGDATSGIAKEQSEQAMLIIVPRTKPDLCRSLEHSFGDDGRVQVILDRRFMDRRARADAREPERRRRGRRLQAAMEAELRAGRWITIPRASRELDFRDPDTRAIMFLCCSEHVIPCQRCQNTYRIGWIRRGDPSVFPCPLCGNDLTSTVVAHAHACPYWAGRGTGTTMPSTNVGPHTPPGQAAAG